MNCPWNGFIPGSTNFCEARLCSWIESPGIAWAGITYIFIGLYIYLKRRDPKDNWLQNLIGLFAISMGVSSFFYHASHIFIFQIWDVGSMFLLGTGIIFLNLRKMKYQLKPWIFWLAIIFEVLLFVTLKGKSGSIILAVLILIFFSLEFDIFRKRPRKTYKYFKVTLTLFIVAVGALWMEHKSGLCNPENHVFQWHAIWDVLCALTYLTLHKHFRQDNN